MDKFVGKRLDGRYEIREIIGVGGMAVVYKAYDSIEDRIVAIKILKEEFASNEEFQRRFKNESKAIAVLSHPNIVKVYDVSFGDLIQYIVMEYIEGITLKEFIEKNDKGWYDQLAVKFKRFDKPVSSKKLSDLKTRLSEERIKLRELETKVVFTEFKAQYISCKKCGSKLNKDYIKRNNCVVCGYDMRSDTTKSAIARLNAKVKSIEEAIKEETRKLEQKKAKEAKEYWLVKIEYHT
jgi:ribosomal protein L37E